MTTGFVFEAQYVDPRSNSDKFYRAFAIGTSLVCQYGRNGTPGTLTPAKDHGSADAAQAAAVKALRAKIAKGYEPTISANVDLPDDYTIADLDAAFRAIGSAAGTAVTPGAEDSVANTDTETSSATDTSSAETSGTRAAGTDAFAALPARPMLADTVSASDLDHLLGSPAWVMQPKLDGDRVVIEVIDGVVSVLNRSGQPKVKNVGEQHVAPFRALPAGRWVIDGEVVGRKFHAFDMAAGLGFDESAGFEQRHAALAALFDELGIADGDEHIGLVAIARGREAKVAMLESAREAGKEGVMFRLLSAPYQPGRRSPDLLKHKFIHEADLVVTRVGIGGKQNIEVAAHDESGELRVVGQVTTIGKGSFAVGDVVEVAFLYVVNADSPRLYQPRVLRKRHDKSAAECSLAQLRAAVTDKTVD